MRGTIVCGVTDSDEGRQTLETGIGLSERLGLRLVLAHVAQGIGLIDGDGDRDGTESVSMKNDRDGAARLVARLAAEYGVLDSAECRSTVGDAAALLSQIAAEEAAAVILVGGRARGRLRRGIASGFVQRLENETSVPVLIVPPRARARSSVAVNGSPR